MPGCCIYQRRRWNKGASFADITFVKSFLYCPIPMALLFHSTHLLFIYCSPYLLAPSSSLRCILHEPRNKHNIRISRNLLSAIHIRSICPSTSPSRHIRGMQADELLRARHHTQPQHHHHHLRWISRPHRRLRLLRGPLLHLHDRQHHLHLLTGQRVGVLHRSERQLHHLDQTIGGLMLQETQGTLNLRCQPQTRM